MVNRKERVAEEQNDHRVARAGALSRENKINCDKSRPEPPLTNTGPSVRRYRAQYKVPCHTDT